MKLLSVVYVVTVVCVVVVVCVRMHAPVVYGVNAVAVCGVVCVVTIPVCGCCLLCSWCIL